MSHGLAAVNGFLANDQGQDILEYAFVAALIALVAMVAVGSMGDMVNKVFWGPIARAF